ncbi:MAG: DUF4440 domain-containing protein [Rhodopseudomonas sp.]|nr:DUF4440 domain-containing protein [Rhodopseudomonas sp.]
MGVAVSEDRTRATVIALYDAYRRRDFDTVAALIHPAIDWIVYSPITVFPFAGPRRGRAAVLEAMAVIAQGYRLESYTDEVMIVEGGRAAVIANVGFQQRATGRSLRFRVSHFLRVLDGQVIEFREFANTFDLVEQALGRELTV